MSTWCIPHNQLLWKELGNTRALGYASAIAIDRLRAYPRFQAALAPYGDHPSHIDVAKVLNEIGPICCFLSITSPDFMSEIIQSARAAAAEWKPDNGVSSR